VIDLQWHSDNRTLLGNFISGRLISEGFAYNGSAIRAWDIVSSEELHAFQITSDGKVAYEFAPGETLIGIGSGNAADLILLWNSDTDDVYNTSLLPDKETEVQITSSEIWAFKLSPDENFIAAGTDDGLVIIWDLRSGERLKTIQLNDTPINKIVWLSSDSKLATLSDHTLKVWNVNQISY
jgi:WD40 repeat protein